MDITGNKFLKIWRNNILPSIISFTVSVGLSVLFLFIPENIFTTNFLAGWLGCMSYYIA